MVSIDRIIYEEQLVLFENLTEYSSGTSLQMSPNFQFEQDKPSWKPSRLDYNED